MVIWYNMDRGYLMHTTNNKTVIDNFYPLAYGTYYTYIYAYTLNYYFKLCLFLQLHQHLLIPIQMNYDESHHTCSLWTIDNPLFIKPIHGYTASIVCKNNFEILLLTSIWNALCKKIATKYFHQKSEGNRKLNTKQSILYNHCREKTITYPNIKTTRLCNLLAAVNPESNVLWQGA